MGVRGREGVGDGGRRGMEKRKRLGEKGGVRGGKGDGGREGEEGRWLLVVGGGGGEGRSRGKEKEGGYGRRKI